MVKKGDPIDWKTAVVTSVQILQQREKVYLNHVWEYHLPEVRATLRQAKDVERQLGFEFPKDYKDLLLHVNRWNCFY